MRYFVLRSGATCFPVLKAGMLQSSFFFTDHQRDVVTARCYTTNPAKDRRRMFVVGSISHGCSTALLLWCANVTKT